MKPRVLSLAIIAVVLIMASCKDKEIEIPVTPTPPEPVDIYASFKADATPRWENGTTIEMNNASAYTFIIDAGGNLFSSSKYKTGRIFYGNDYEILEFDGQPTVGKPTGAAIRKPSGTVALNSFEIIKTESGKLWIVFKETAASTERRIVQ